MCPKRRPVVNTWLKVAKQQLMCLNIENMVKDAKSRQKGLKVAEMSKSGEKRKTREKWLKMAKLAKSGKTWLKNG